jgi:predicted metal-binding membrane protein
MPELASSATALRRTPPSRELGQAAAVVLLLGLTAAAWTLTDRRMGGMDAGPGTDLGGLGWFAVTWALMMAAMMLPAVAPTVAAYRRRAASAGATPTFAAGYLIAWLAAGLLGYALVEGVRSLALAFLAWGEAGRWLAAAVILGGALYQLTGPKDACLRRCRDARAFLAERWRPGRVGALRMGMEHGGLCVGCCWALMAALFAVGVMSIGWMAFVAALIAAERLLPWKTIAARGVAVVLAVLALAVTFAPDDVPGLTVPGSDPGAPSMESMPMR